MPPADSPDEGQRVGRPDHRKRGELQFPRDYRHKQMVGGFYHRLPFGSRSFPNIAAFTNWSMARAGNVRLEVSWLTALTR